MTNTLTPPAENVNQFHIPGVIGQIPEQPSPVTAEMPPVRPVQEGGFAAIEDDPEGDIKLAEFRNSQYVEALGEQHTTPSDIDAHRNDVHSTYGSVPEVSATMTAAERAQHQARAIQTAVQITDALDNLQNNAVRAEYINAGYTQEDLTLAA